MIARCLRRTLARAARLAGILFALLASACSGPLLEVATVSAKMVVPEEAAASITPGPAPQPVSYRLTGTGPASASFSQTVLSLPADIDGLLPGDWVIGVEALDAGGQVVLEGSLTTMVASGGATPIAVVLAPPVGVGQVSIGLLWPSALVADPQVVAVLESETAGSIPISVQLAAQEGSATCTALSVPSGWYHLRLQLLDGASVVAGQVELLQVRAAATTAAPITITELNKPGAPVSIQGASLTLFWDPDLTGNPADPTASYNLYSRTHGTFPWTLLGNTGTATESFSVSTDILPHGSYDFAVTAVTASGAESELHTSLDDTAQPQTGWYVVWEP
jgi:hypothetical protein